MAGVKPFASLSGGLLARKGAARPAMRPQGFAFATPAPAGIEDLGWNDMGTVPAPAPAASTPVAPVAEPARPVPVAETPTAGYDLPPVLIEREALAAQIEAPGATVAVSVPTAARLRRETAHAGKAALTLRLDGERHLRLRLAGALTNRSAQDLLVQALDALIAAVPTVDALVAQLPPAKTPRSRPRQERLP